MADYASAAAGAHDTPTNWTPNGVPGDLDKITNVTHAITVAGGVTWVVGEASTTAAIVIGTGGSITLADTANLDAKGHLDYNGGKIRKEGSGRVRLVNGAGGPYHHRISRANSQLGSLLEVVGTAGARTTIDYTGTGAQIPADGKVVSLAHKNDGQGDEAFFMNAMLATELLRWHGFVESQPGWVALARRIVDHLIDENSLRGAACLPYTAKGKGCASDLAGYYVWPALVLWQETGDMKYQTFALANIAAAKNAFISQTKAFNQAYSTGAQSAEALLAGVAWR